MVTDLRIIPHKAQQDGTELQIETADDREQENIQASPQVREQGKGFPTDLADMDILS